MTPCNQTEDETNSWQQNAKDYFDGSRWPKQIPGRVCTKIRILSSAADKIISTVTPLCRGRINQSAFRTILDARHLSNLCCLPGSYIDAVSRDVGVLSTIDVEMVFLDRPARFSRKVGSIERAKPQEMTSPLLIVICTCSHCWSAIED
jgi:hypothetical protein